MAFVTGLLAAAAFAAAGQLQPAPADEPVPVEAPAEAEESAEAADEAASEAAESAAEASEAAAESAAEAAASAQADAEQAAADEEERMVCRLRIVEGAFGKQKSVKVCKTKAQWAAGKARGR